MAKLTQQQRSYFEERIGAQFKNQLDPLEKVAALKKADFVNERFENFIDSLGLTESLKELKKTEIRLQAIQQSLSLSLTNLSEQYQIGNGYRGYGNEWSWSTSEGLVKQVETALRKMCRKECEIAFKEFPEGQEIEKLKNKKREALDYIYGYDQQKELLDGLSSLLKGSGVAMLTEYKEIK